MSASKSALCLAVIFVTYGCAQTHTTESEKQTISVEVECIDSTIARYCLDLVLDGAEIVPVQKNYAKYRVNDISQSKLGLFEDLNFCPGYESTPGMAFRFHKTSDPTETLFQSAIVLPSLYKIDERIAFKGPDGEGVLCNKQDWSKLKPLFDEVFGGLDDVQ